MSCAYTSCSWTGRTSRKGRWIWEQGSGTLITRTEKGNSFLMNFWFHRFHWMLCVCVFVSWVVSLSRVDGFEKNPCVRMPTYAWRGAFFLSYWQNRHFCRRVRMQNLQSLVSFCLTSSTSEFAPLSILALDRMDGDLHLLIHGTKQYLSDHQASALKVCWKQPLEIIPAHAGPVCQLLSCRSLFHVLLYW